MKTRRIFLRLLLAGSVFAVHLHARIGVAQTKPTHAVVHIGPLDGQILVQESLDKGKTKDFSLLLSPNAEGFAVKNDRVSLNATASYLGFSCAVHIDGKPMLKDNRLGMDAPILTTEGIPCNGLLSALKPLVLQSLQAHPWDLLKRLARASSDAALPGPRLAQTGCIREDQLTIETVTTKDSQLVVDIAIAPRIAGSPCP